MEIASKRRNETLAPISHLSCLAIAQDLAGCRYFSRGCWRLELPNSAPRAVNWDQIKFVEELHISIFFDNLVKAINCCLSLILVVQCRLCSISSSANTTNGLSVFSALRWFQLPIWCSNFEGTTETTKAIDSLPRLTFWWSAWRQTLHQVEQYWKKIVRKRVKKISIGDTDTN